MTPKAQRKAIAEACITSMWCCRCSGRSENGVRATLMRYGAPFCSDKCAESAGDYAIEDGQQSIPDYLTDLNAMHGAEKVLFNHPTDKPWMSDGLSTADARYIHYLVKITGAALIRHEGLTTYARLGEMVMIRASAAQRAEAFLRTLNLWTVSTPPTPKEREQP